MRQGYDNSDRTARGQYIKMDKSVLVRKTIAIHRDSRNSGNGAMGKPSSFHNHSEGAQVERAKSANEVKCDLGEVIVYKERKRFVSHVCLSAIRRKH